MPNTITDNRSLAYSVTRYVLAMRGLASAVSTEMNRGELVYGTLGKTLYAQIRQLERTALDVAKERLQPSDIALLVRELKGTLRELGKTDVPALVTRQLIYECSRIESILLAHGESL